MTIQGTCLATATFVDKTLPAVKCPTTVSSVAISPTTCQGNKLCKQYQCIARYPNLITSTTATDNCATSFTFTQSPTNTAVISAPGSYNVLLSTTDPSGNKGNFAFNIIHSYKEIVQLL